MRRSYADDPLTWKVSFRMTDGGMSSGAMSADMLEGKLSRKRPSRAGKLRPEPHERRCVIPYAHRIEALRRAINGRKAYVLRYARRLARLAHLDAGRLARIAQDKRRALEAFCTALIEDHGLPVNVDLPPWSAKHEEPG